MQIVQEINSRIKLLQDKKKLRSINDYSKVFQEKLVSTWLADLNYAAHLNPQLTLSKD